MSVKNYLNYENRYLMISRDNIKTFCINLDDRPERWAEVKEEIKVLGIDIERFSAVRTKPGWQGCLLSHMKLLSTTRLHSIFMIIEDDILFMEDAKENLQLALDQLPDNWDMLYLGATLNAPLERVTRNILRLKRGWTTHGIIYNNQNGVVDHILENAEDKRIDTIFADDVQENFNVFMTFPMVATQRPGYSDIVNRHQDYSVIDFRYRRYVENFHKIDDFG